MLQHLNINERKENVAVLGRADVDVTELNAILHGRMDVQMLNNLRNEEQQDEPQIEEDEQQLVEEQNVVDDIDADEADVLNQTLSEVHQWFKDYEALDLLPNFIEFRCVADVVEMKEEEFIEAGINTLRDKLTLRRMIKEYKSSQVVRSQEQHVAQQPPQLIAHHQPQPQPPNDEEESKRIPPPTQEQIDNYIQYALFFVIHSGEKNSGKMRKKFSDNTNKPPFLFVKKYIPSQFAVNSKKYKCSPHVIIRHSLEGLRDLGIVTLQNVKDPANDRGAKCWSAEIKFQPLQKAWNQASVGNREKMHAFLVKSTRGNGG